nr:MAG TPA: hypothetical protein [Caudoviricetes sp.]
MQKKRIFIRKYEQKKAITDDHQQEKAKKKNGLKALYLEKVA